MPEIRSSEDVAKPPSEAAPLQDLDYVPQFLDKEPVTPDLLHGSLLVEVFLCVPGSLITQVWKHLPNRLQFSDLRLLYCSQTHGTSMNTFFRNVEDMGPTLLVVKDRSTKVCSKLCADNEGLWWFLERVMAKRGQLFWEWGIVCIFVISAGHCLPLVQAKFVLYVRPSGYDHIWWRVIRE